MVLIVLLFALAMAMGNVLACHQLAARLFAVVVALAMISTVMAVRGVQLARFFAVAVAMAMMIFTSMLVWEMRDARLFAVTMPVVMMIIAASMATSR